MPFLNSKLGIDFSAYIADRTTNFTGREWVFEAIQNWLADPKGERFFLLTGEPGSGKTAIAARLTQFAQGVISHPRFDAGFLHAVHFCSARDSVWTDPKEFVRSIALQLAQSIPEFGLALKDIGEKTNNINIDMSVETAQNSTIQGVVIQNLTISGLTGQEAFTQVVVNPLRQIREEGFNQPVTILVDSLDEALTHDGESTIVDLLSKLSSGVKVRLILTSRNEARVKEKLVAYEELFLSATEHLAQNQKDVRVYIGRRFSEDETLQNYLKAESLNKEALTTTLIDKSEGNFLYVRFLLDSVASGQQSLTNLEGLPQGLDELYYGSLVRVVEFGKKDWSDVYAPVMGVLLAAQESLTESQIRAFTKLKESVVWNCLNDLQQFLDEIESEDEETRYKLYHQSVTDFLGKRQLLICKKKQNNRYYLPAQEQHQRIVDYYQAGAKSWLDIDWTSIKDDYAFRYLPYHLKQAGQHQDLCKLLTSAANWMQAKFIHYGSDEGYVSDLQLALNAFTNPGVPEQVAQLVQLHTARQVIYHRASRYNDTDLKTLVWLGGEAQAIQHARLRPSASQRFDSFWAIYNTQRAKGQPPNSALLREMWEQAQLIDIDFEETRIAALGKIATALAQIGHRSEITTIITEATNALKLEANQIRATVESIRSVKNPRWGQLEAFKELATILVQLRLFTEAEEVVQAIADDNERANAFSRLAITLAQVGQFVKTEQIAQSIESSWERAEVLKHLAIALAQAGQFTKAEQIAQSIEQDQTKAEAFSQLAIALAQAEQFTQAKKLIQKICSSGTQVEALSQLATALIQAQQQSEAVEVFAEAREIAQTIENYEARIEALSKLATALAHVEQKPEAVEIFAEARETAQIIEDSRERDKILRQLSIALAEVKYFTDAEQVAQTVEDYRDRAETLRQLAVALAQVGQPTNALTIFTEAGEIDQAINSSGSQAQALRQLAFALAQVGQFNKAEQVAQAIQGSENRALVFKDLAVNLIQLGHQSEAMTFFKKAEEIAQINKSDSLLSKISLALTQTEQFAEAERVALVIKNAESRALALNNLATALIQTEQQSEAVIFLLKAEEIARNGKSNSALRIVARSLTKIGKFTEAEQAALAISFLESRSEALKELVVALAWTEKFSEAKRLTQSIEAIGSRTSALKELVNALVRIGQFTEAEQLARSIEVPRSRALALKGLASALAKAGRFTDAEQVAQSIDDSKIQSETVTDLVQIRQTVEAEKGLTESSNVAQNIKLEEKQLDVLEHSPVTATQVINFEEALVAIGLLELNEFLSILSEWTSAFEKVELGLSVTVLSEAVRIAGWVHPDWRKISELLNTQAG
jgi:tetratricopeptide (TPR) repeat protein